MLGGARDEDVMPCMPPGQSVRSREEKLALEVCNQVTLRVTPSSDERERVYSLVNRLVKAAEVRCRSVTLDARVEVFGSVAKDTWLSGEADIDLFLLVTPETPRDAMVVKALQVGRAVIEEFHGHWTERYAEHPYVEGWVEGTRVNFVPCYEVKNGGWLTAVDRTPLHTQYVKGKLSDEAKREVRLLKRFMKGVEVYGADIKVSGFSGYLCELLVIRYSLLLEALKAAARWKPGTTLLIEPIEGIGLEEAKTAFPEPLIVVDPVDARRNVASAVSLQRMSEFIAASKAFLKRPTITFFYPPAPEVPDTRQLVEDLSARGTDLLVLGFGRVDAVPDVLWGQMYRTMKALVTLLEEHDFNVLRASAWSDEKNSNAFTFELEQAHLPVAKTQTGPPVTAREVQDFMRKHLHSSRTISGPWIRDDRWAVVTRRKETDATSLLEKISREAAEIGVRDKIAEALKRGHRFYVGTEVAEFSKANPAYAAFLASFLAGAPIWLEPQKPLKRDRVAN